MTHHDERLSSSNAFAQNTAPQGDSIRELRRQRANPEVPPGVQAQRRDAANADAASQDDAAAELRGALTVLRAGHSGEANVFLERFESRLLMRSTLSARAGIAARAALLRHDLAAARREIEAALAAFDQQRPALKPH